MRHPQPAIAKKLNTKTGEMIYYRPNARPVLADSLEVQEGYYSERIHSFNEMLEQLNILQDAPEIEFLCKEIIEARGILNNIANKKNMA